MNTSKKLGTLIYSFRPEGVNNPAVGGVFTSKEDPTNWFCIDSITKNDDGKTLGFTTRSSASNIAISKTMAYIGNTWYGYEVHYNYIAGGTQEAREAVRHPKARLRDILLRGCKAA